MLSSLEEKDQATGGLEAAKILGSIPAHHITPNALIYYADLVLCVLLGNGALILASLQPLYSGAQVALVIASALLLYRASFFLHESVHAAKKLKGFTTVYNVLHGYLHKLPAYCYIPHLEHHQVEHYGKSDDAEYERLSKKSPFLVLFVFPLLQPLPLPLYMVLRWGMLPVLLPFIGTKGRAFVYKRISYIGFNPRYKRPDPDAQQRRQWYIQDACGVLYTLVIAGLIYMQVLPLVILPLWYVAMVLAHAINFYRTIMVHRYFGEFDGMNRKQMILDSVTLPLTKLNVLMFPLGTGYHALHHLFPHIPYYSLHPIHHQLMETLPEDHPYRATVIPNYHVGLQSLLSGQFN